MQCWWIYLQTIPPRKGNDLRASDSQFSYCGVNGIPKERMCDGFNDCSNGGDDDGGWRLFGVLRCARTLPRAFGSDVRPPASTAWQCLHMAPAMDSLMVSSLKLHVDEQSPRARQTVLDRVDVTLLVDGAI
ncbi:hypothetical protein E2C01_001895 [Portunus trituberculatus]|uniref:Uncharacterized protein n=1 Tax=Portunus trituberculatus TaxID=210409 RepID=A0A5B7CIG0_PORTR|nr:hypothetical protein [Portunus trituberculatus]